MPVPLKIVVFSVSGVVMTLSSARSKCLKQSFMFVLFFSSKNLQFVKNVALIFFECFMCNLQTTILKTQKVLKIGKVMKTY